MLGILVALALKSLLVAAITLGALRLTRRRSAAERSLIAHLGLFALVALPLAGLMLPSLNLPLPTAPAEPVLPVTIAHSGGASVSAVALPAMTADAAPAAPRFDWTPYAYAAPAVGLLLLTLAALLRLFALSRRAEVLVEPVWLSALAHAQRRMGLKSGTALLVSDALPSPISWGWARPVILLNRDALTAGDDAEAIIAHELAHVVSFDWAKLMLARLATALFWFNPLAWVLAREAHQLREEAADDAVLATAIPGPDYAQLLVGVARHEAKGLLLGALGVAPGKDSLRRRVGRVLDSSLARGPAGRSWVAGFGTGMLVMAAPLAALTIGPKPAAREESATAHVVTTATADSRSIETPDDGRTVMRRPDAATIDLAAPDAQGRQAVTLRGANGATLRVGKAGRVDFALHAGNPPAWPQVTPKAIDEAIALKAVGVTPDEVAALEAAGPWLGRLSVDDAVALKAVGVTPAYIRDLAAARITPLRRDDLMQARAVGLTGAYARAMAAAGYRGGVDRLIEMRAVGVGPADLTRSPRSARHATADGDDNPDPDPTE